jgi:hypothetical protein
MPVNVKLRQNKAGKSINRNYLLFNSIINEKGFQKWIGYVDVKSVPVYFYVQRNTPFYPQNTPIPFELERVNEGNGMDLASGKFTAPRPGIYFFSFTGNGGLFSSSEANFYFRLFLNGNLIGSTHVQEMNGPISEHSPMSFQSTLKLEKGDRVWVQMEYSPAMYLSDESTHTTHFTGFMLEEEIVAAL